MSNVETLTRPAVMYCEATLTDGTKCDRHTWERKPYCSEHVERQDRVKWIATELKVREREVLALARGKQTQAPENSRLLKDVLAIVLEVGPVVSLERMTLLLDAELSPLEDASVRASRRATKAGESAKPSEVDTWASTKALKAKVTQCYMATLVAMGLGRWRVTKRGVLQLVMTGHEEAVDREAADHEEAA